MTNPVNPYGGDANVKTAPQFEIPMMSGPVNNRVWYRFLAALGAVPQYSACTVANLPQPNIPARGFVTDATSTTFSSTVAGSGSNFVPVFFDGKKWRIG